jgi:hypothetical protein
VRQYAVVQAQHVADLMAKLVDNQMMAAALHA